MTNFNTYRAAANFSFSSDIPTILPTHQKGGSQVKQTDFSGDQILSNISLIQNERLLNFSISVVSRIP